MEIRRSVKDDVENKEEKAKRFKVLEFEKRELRRHVKDVMKKEKQRKVYE